MVARAAAMASVSPKKVPEKNTPLLPSIICMRLRLPTKAEIGAAYELGSRLGRGRLSPAYQPLRVAGGGRRHGQA